MTASIDMVPEEVLTMIFSYLSYDDLVSVQDVCTHWQHVSMNKALWKHHIYIALKDTSNKEIMHLLKKSPKLRAVDLCNVMVSRKVIEVLCDTCTDVRVLQFHATQKLDKKLVKRLLTCCPNIEELCVPRDFFYEAATFKTITGFEHLKLLKISGKIHYVKFNTVIRTVDTEVVHHVAKSFNILAETFPNLIELNLEEADFTTLDLERVLEIKGDQLETLHTPCWARNKKCVLPLLNQCSNLKCLRLHLVCRRISEFIPELPSSLKNVTLVQANFECRDYCERLFEIFSRVTVFKFSLCCGPSNHLVETIALKCPAVQKLIFYGCILIMNCLNMASLRLMPDLNSIVISEDLDLSDEGVHFLKEVSELVEIEIFSCVKVTIESLKILLSMPKLQRLKYDLLFRKYKPSDFQVESVARSVKNLRMRVLLYGCGYVPYIQMKYFRRLLPDLQIGIVNGKSARLPPHQRLVSINMPSKDKNPMAYAMRLLFMELGHVFDPW